MARVLVSLVLLLSEAGHSSKLISHQSSQLYATPLLICRFCDKDGFRQEASALYCLCKDGVARSSLEAAFDLACATGADCLAIVPNETCYDLKSLKSRCDYAVNSYFQITGRCDFNGVANTSHIAPKMPPGCVPQSPGPAAGRGRHYFGTRALPSYYFGPGIIPVQTGAAAALSGNWSIDPVLFWLTASCLMLILV